MRNFNKAPKLPWRMYLKSLHISRVKLVNGTCCDEIQRVCKWKANQSSTKFVFAMLDICPIFDTVFHVQSVLMKLALNSCNWTFVNCIFIELNLVSHHGILNMQCAALSFWQVKLLNNITLHDISSQNHVWIFQQNSMTSKLFWFVDVDNFSKSLNENQHRRIHSIFFAHFVCRMIRTK